MWHLANANGHWINTHWHCYNEYLALFQCRMTLDKHLSVMWPLHRHWPCAFPPCGPTLHSACSMFPRSRATWGWGPSLVVHLSCAPCQPPFQTFDMCLLTSQFETNEPLDWPAFFVQVCELLWWIISMWGTSPNLWGSSQKSEGIVFLGHWFFQLAKFNVLHLCIPLLLLD